MDDKTLSTRLPSTTFDDSSSSSTLLQLTSSSPLSTKSIPSNNSSNPTVAMESKKIEISSLISPPQPKALESFEQIAPVSESGLQSRPLLSPPASPEELEKLKEGQAVVENGTKDPILFPQSEPNTQSTEPLFSEHDRIVEEHIAARKAEPLGSTSPPRKIDYQNFFHFTLKAADGFNRDRQGWHRREMEQLRIDDAARSSTLPRKYAPIAPARGPRIAPKAAKPQGIVKKPRPRPVVRQDTPDRQQKVAREDKEFDKLDDFCPPLDSLPNKPNSLKVDWKGQPIDLRGDPHAHLLHPDELLLAGNLRLDCATYLTSKRRIFMKRKDCLAIGKEFRKTDAQQACKIDVNKASKLWAVFEKVGWLHPKWMA